MKLHNVLSLIGAATGAAITISNLAILGTGNPYGLLSAGFGLGIIPKPPKG